MSEPGQSFRVLAVRFERTLPGPADRVWQCLTDCSRLAGWYGTDGVITPHEGGAVKLMGSHIRGVVTQWKPNRRLAYTWNVFSAGDAESPYPESFLSFDLEPRGVDVRLTLQHMPILDRFEKQNKLGWHTFLDMVEAAISGHVEGREVYSKRNAVRYGVDLNNLKR